MLSRLERTKLFFERLKDAPPCATAAEAMEQLSSILEAIEDAFTSIQNDPANWETDGRLYPPREDSRRAVPGHDDIVRYRSRKHNTWIARNGAIRIMQEDRLCLEKPGRDGRTVTSMMARATFKP